MPYYFAFGPDIGPGDISGLLAAPANQPLKPVAVAKLNGYTLVFKHPAGLSEPVADIVQSPDDCVFGLLYDFQTGDLAKMNVARQARYRASNVLLTVEGGNGTLAALPVGTTITASTHEALEKDASSEPVTDEFLARLVDCVKTYGIPAAYVRGVGAPQSPTPLPVSEIVIDSKVLTGETVKAIYTKVPPLYAVYQTEKRVAIQFSDDPARAASQRARMTALNSVRAQLTALIDGWSVSRFAINQARAQKYNARIAAALIVGLEGDAIAALMILNDIKGDLLQTRTSWGRFEYLISACVVASLLVSVLYFMRHVVYREGDASVPTGPLWLAARAGVVGAFFSIAIAIRKRTILPDIFRRDNCADAALRVAIGALGAGALLFLIESGVVPPIKLGDATIGHAAMTWQTVAALGFVAGFLERLVPDLLEKQDPAKNEGATDAGAAQKTASSTGTPASKPAGGTT
jgi:hypothetical protein